MLQRAIIKVRAMYIAYLLLLGAAIISNSFLMFILLRYSQKGYAIISFVIFLVCINLWIAPLFFINVLHAHGILFENLNRFAALGYVFTPVTFVVFSLAYTMHYKLLRV